MRQQLTEGTEVTVSSAIGYIRRTIVKVIGDVVVLGSKADYEHAKTFGISAFCIGFRVSDVLDENTLDVDEEKR